MPNGRNEGRLYPERETLDLLEKMGTDGEKWATECLGVLSDKGYIAGDAEVPAVRELLVGWFANAIEKGRQNPALFDPLTPDELRDVATEVLERNAEFGTDFDGKINQVAACLRVEADRKERRGAGS